jgi:low affinity Fe/Cu permease
MNEAFRRIASFVSHLAGLPWAFSAAVALILGWLVTGPFFGFSDTWQLVINTGTTIITFLMVFLIQNTQNRETKAINLKLDELIRAVTEARNSMVDLEDASDEELDTIQVQFQRLRERVTNEEKR